MSEVGERADAMNVPLSDIDLAKYRPRAVAHLDRLGWAIAENELCAVARYAEVVPLLRVFHPALPCIVETVAVVPPPGVHNSRAWWFCLSTGDPIAPCTELAQAVRLLLRALAPIIQAEARQRAT